MIFSKTCMYGIRAALFVTIKQNGEEYVSIKEISRQLNISFHFLTKILQILTQQKIMESYRGPKGGVRLARPANEIYLKEIILAIDGVSLFKDCILGLPGCGELKPCPFHDEWTKIRVQIESLLEDTTLASAVNDIERFGLRLGDPNPD